MAIREIKLTDFNRFKPLRAPAAASIVKEQAWYASDDSKLIGVLTLDAVDDDWGFIVMGKDKQGNFRAIEVEVSLASKEQAKNGLLAAMEAKLASGDIEA